MPMRAVSMRMGFPFGMRVAGPMRMLVLMTVFGRWGGCVTTKVMVMAMRGLSYRRIRNPPLLADLHLFGHLVVVFVTASLGVRNEALERRLIHMA